MGSFIKIKLVEQKLCVFYFFLNDTESLRFYLFVSAYFFFSASLNPDCLVRALSFNTEIIVFNSSHENRDLKLSRIWAKNYHFQKSISFILFNLQFAPQLVN